MRRKKVDNAAPYGKLTLTLDLLTAAVTGKKQGRHNVIYPDFGTLFYGKRTLPELLGRNRQLTGGKGTAKNIFIVSVKDSSENADSLLFVFP